jgi:hypothetical protein
MVTDAVAPPPELVPRTVYVAKEVTEVGVPDITPVEESITRPEGRAGLTDQSVIIPPVYVGVTEDMVEFFASERKLGL